MNERAVWRLVIEFVLVAAVVYLSIEVAGHGSEIQRSEQRAEELKQRSAAAETQATQWRASTMAARDSLKLLQDELEKRPTPRERIRVVYRHAYGLPADSLIDGLSREVPDFR